MNEPFEFELIVRPAGTLATVGDDVTITVDADMPDHRHGMNTTPRVERIGPGRYRAEGLQFHMPGYWEIYIDITRGGVTERAALPVELE